MEHQAFSKVGMQNAIRKSDFLHVPAADHNIFRAQLLFDAMIAVKTNFSAPANPLSQFRLMGRNLFQLRSKADQLVERKLATNIRRVCGIVFPSRSAAINNLKLLLIEGLPLRVYRLDIYSFYESFDKKDVIDHIRGLHRLSPKSKQLLYTLLERHTELGGSGLPRGLHVSAILSELMMKSFDKHVQDFPDVFFYYRYVDDAILITSGNEDHDQFISLLKSKLPKGLSLNKEKVSISEKIGPVVAAKSSSPKTIVASFEYLGYRFSVNNPYKGSGEKNWRKVDIDIAKKKTKKYKTRISKAALDFTKTKDWELFRDRIKFLSKNFSVYNTHIGRKKLAGIYYSYPALCGDARALHELDHFVRGLVLTKRGRIGPIISKLLTPAQKRELLSNCFSDGHAKKTFIHFTPTRINEIQKCWEH